MKGFETPWIWYQSLQSVVLIAHSGYCSHIVSISFLIMRNLELVALLQVPIGAWYGNGRKAGWYSPFLLACWDPEAEEFQSVCRVMSGFSDAFYTASKERFSSKHLLSGPKPYYNTGESPDVWFEAVEVWEIRGADITLSPVHKSAVGKLHGSRGCSLRFPRFIQVSLRDSNLPRKCHFCILFCVKQASIGLTLHNVLNILDGPNLVGIHFLFALGPG